MLEDETSYQIQLEKVFMESKNTLDQPTNFLYTCTVIMKIMYFSKILIKITVLFTGHCIIVKEMSYYNDILNWCKVVF